MECLTFGLKLLELLYINHDNTILHMIGKGLGGGACLYNDFNFFHFFKVMITLKLCNINIILVITKENVFHL